MSSYFIKRQVTREGGLGGGRETRREKESWGIHASESITLVREACQGYL